MGEYPLDVRAARKRAAEHQAHDRARRIERKFDGRRRDVRDDAAQETRRGRMEIDHRLAPVEFVEHRREGFVARPLVVVVGHQRDAVDLEHVEGIFDFAQAAFGIGQRKSREVAEAALVVALDPRTGLVAFACQRA